MIPKKTKFILSDTFYSNAALNVCGKTPGTVNRRNFPPAPHQMDGTSHMSMIIKDYGNQ
ncbi:hypothetical protein OB236_14460 [Paenibacillus sp. WQ 127069]|uniref:Uncharacterized protein n=1 Tax=Paenibacillus baimaensis TaxID=2982185 RepID=A0ABT2UFC6_9BACL|nr:hypothetical protein [Paenibacillus sp. WQ 127069]